MPCDWIFVVPFIACRMIFLDADYCYLVSCFLPFVGTWYQWLGAAIFDTTREYDMKSTWKMQVRVKNGSTRLQSIKFVWVRGLTREPESNLPNPFNIFIKFLKDKVIFEKL